MTKVCASVSSSKIMIINYVFRSHYGLWCWRKNYIIVIIVNVPKVVLRTELNKISRYFSQSQYMMRFNLIGSDSSYGNRIRCYLSTKKRTFYWSKVPGFATGLWQHGTLNVNNIIQLINLKSNFQRLGNSQSFKLDQPKLCKDDTGIHLINLKWKRTTRVTMLLSSLRSKH